MFISLDYKLHKAIAEITNPVEHNDLHLIRLVAMLKQDGPIPSAPFQELEVLLPAKDFKNRHASILLSLDATLAAFAELDHKNAQSN